MQQVRIPTGDPDIESWHSLVEAIAEEIAAGAPHDPKALIARLAARQVPAGLEAYLSAMFTDPD